MDIEINRTGVQPKGVFLDDDDVLIINKTLAKAIGLDEAILLKQVHYWLKIYSKSNKEKHLRDGRWWVYNAYADWKTDNFDFWSWNKIQRIISKLESLGILLSSSKYNARRGDQTKWYTIDYIAYEAFIKLWADCAYPLEWSNADAHEYEAFINLWNEQRSEPSIIAMRDDQYTNLLKAVPQFDKTVTRDYNRELKEKDSVRHSTHDVLSTDDGQPTIEELQARNRQLELELAQTKAPKAKRERKPKDVAVSAEPKPKTNRDLIFDAVTEHMWKIRDAKPIGKTATRIGMAVSEIISNDKNATPADIPVFAKWCAGYIPQDPAKVGAAWLRWRSQTQASTQRQEELTWELPEDVRNMGKLDSYLKK